MCVWIVKLAASIGTLLVGTKHVQGETSKENKHIVFVCCLKGYPKSTIEAVSTIWVEPVGLQLKFCLVVFCAIIRNEIPKKKEWNVYILIARSWNKST